MSNAATGRKTRFHVPAFAKQTTSRSWPKRCATSSPRSIGRAIRSAARAPWRRWTRVTGAWKRVVAWRWAELDWLDTLGLRARWTGLASVACIESHRHIGEKCETDTRYVISSLPAQARPILHAVRTHWGVENVLHWCLDVTFGEYASAVRLRNAAHNFSFLRRLALNLFRTDTPAR